MRRITISVDSPLAAAFDDLIESQLYESRSEAVRDLVRAAVENRRSRSGETGFCVACLSYVYEHHTRALAQRLTELQHERHDVVLSTTHVHLDHDTCLETTILKGATWKVRALADAIKAERGVRFAEINLISITPNGHHDERDGDHQHGDHAHSSPCPG